MRVLRLQISFFPQYVFPSYDEPIKLIGNTILPPHANTNILNVFRLDHCFKFNPPPLQSQMSQHSLPHSMSPIGSGIGYGMSGLPCSMQTSPTSINQSMIMVSCSHLFTSFPSLLSLLPLLLDSDWWLRA